MKATRAFRTAIELARQELTIDPRDPQVLKYIANYHAMVADRAEARKYMTLALEASKFDKDSLFTAATVFNNLGESGMAMEWLAKALRGGYSPETVMRQPDLDNLHGDKRFQDLLKSSSSGPNRGK
jgi:Tfp pilus assembly protein PilF